MKFAIIGSRKYPALFAVKQTVYGLPADACVVSGGAIGVDLVAEQAADARGLSKIIHKPDWNKYGKRAGFVRNELIVLDADLVIAFWDGTSKGTEHSIDLASKHKKPYVVYGPPIIDIIQFEDFPAFGDFVPHEIKFTNLS